MAPDRNSREAHANALLRFIDSSPSPFHVVESAADLLLDSGFTESLTLDSLAASGTHFYRSDGALFAWRIPEGATGQTPFRIVGAHTDSPNLRLKPDPSADTHGYRRLGVEVYGGVLLNSWLDRDLGLSGRIAVRDGTTAKQVLISLDEPILRIPQLAIHLDREINDKGLRLNRQQHLAPIYGLTGSETSDIWSVVASAAGVSSTDIIGADLMLHDTQPSALIGVDRDFISAARLDNQLSCHAALTALIGTSATNSMRWSRSSTMKRLVP